jgi:hypothetical protein
MTQIGLDGSLNKGMDISNTIQGGKVVVKNVFMTYHMTYDTG